MSCAICLNQLNEPVTHACGQNTCKACLLAWHEQNAGSGGTTRCPLCNGDFAPPYNVNRDFERALLQPGRAPAGAQPAEAKGGAPSRGCCGWRLAAPRAAQPPPAAPARAAGGGAPLTASFPSLSSLEDSLVAPLLAVPAHVALLLLVLRGLASWRSLGSHAGALAASALLYAAAYILRPGVALRYSAALRLLLAAAPAFLAHRAGAPARCAAAALLPWLALEAAARAPLPPAPGGPQALGGRLRALRLLLTAGCLLLYGEATLAALAALLAAGALRAPPLAALAAGAGAPESAVRAARALDQCAAPGALYAALALAGGWASLPTAVGAVALCSG